MDNKEVKNDWTKSAATAILRWALGFLFIFTSFGKFYYQGKWSFENAKWFVTGYLLEDKLRESFLPKWLIAGYGYALPYCELLLGVLLILGIARNKVLFAAGLLLITLLIGAIQMKDYSVVYENFFYIFICAVLLFCPNYYKWLIVKKCSANSDKTT